MKDKIKIINGNVYDPITGIFAIKDVAISNGMIVDDADFKEDITIDATDCLVTPGLIDFHLHCFNGGSDGSCDADTFCLPNGTTTCIDAGTSGCANFEAFYSRNIARSVTRVFALLSLASEGQTTGRHPENQTPDHWDKEYIKRLFDRYPQLVGIKIRLGHNICAPFGMTDEPLSEGVKFAEEIGQRVVVHVNDPDVGTDRIADMLRKGDVFCHMYAGKTTNILSCDNKVNESVKEAKTRGVIFDACNGRGNFLFNVAEPAIKDGFWPDIISSDNSVYGNYKQPLISLPRLMSKYLMFGMSLKEVLDAVTIKPAEWLNMKSLASMEYGTEADIAIFKLVDKDVIHKDFTGEKRVGHQVFVPQLTIKDGVIVYSQSDFL